jgi:hypothetical protein
MGSGKIIKPDAFLRYHYEQGLSEKPMRVEDLFARETLDEEFKNRRKEDRGVS